MVALATCVVVIHDSALRCAGFVVGGKGRGGPHSTAGARHFCTFCWPRTSQAAWDREVRADGPLGRDAACVAVAVISSPFAASSLRPPALTLTLTLWEGGLLCPCSTRFPSFRRSFGRRSWCHGAEEGTRKRLCGLGDTRARGSTWVSWGLLSPRQPPATLPLPDTGPLFALGFCGSGTGKGCGTRTPSECPPLSSWLVCLLASQQLKDRQARTAITGETDWPPWPHGRAAPSPRPLSVYAHAIWKVFSFQTWYLPRTPSLLSPVCQ